VEVAPSFTGFKPAIRVHLVSWSDFHKKALEDLLQDCVKKRYESAKNLGVKKALKRPRPERTRPMRMGRKLR